MYVLYRGSRDFELAFCTGRKEEVRFVEDFGTGRARRCEKRRSSGRAIGKVGTKESINFDIEYSFGRQGSMM
jgi:hypothetical protein